MGQTQETYQTATLEILTQFQLLEQALKMYISAAYEVIGARVKGLLPFHYGGVDVESFPLERLISTFAKVNDNRDLISRLNKLPKKRNEVAHKSLLIAWGGYQDLKKQQSALDGYRDLISDLGPCLQGVMEEMRRLPRPDHGSEA